MLKSFQLTELMNFIKNYCTKRQTAASQLSTIFLTLSLLDFINRYGEKKERERERDEDERSGRYQTIKNEGKKSFHFRNLFFVLMLLLTQMYVYTICFK